MPSDYSFKNIKKCELCHQDMDCLTITDSPTDSRGDFRCDRHFIFHNCKYGKEENITNIKELKKHKTVNFCDSCFDKIYEFLYIRNKNLRLKEEEKIMDKIYKATSIKRVEAILEIEERKGMPGNPSYECPLCGNKAENHNSAIGIDRNFDREEIYFHPICNLCLKEFIDFFKKNIIIGDKK